MQPTNRKLKGVYMGKLWKESKVCFCIPKSIVSYDTQFNSYLHWKYSTLPYEIYFGVNLKLGLILLSVNKWVLWYKYGMYMANDIEGLFVELNFRKTQLLLQVRKINIIFNLLEKGLLSTVQVKMT